MRTILDLVWVLAWIVGAVLLVFVVKWLFHGNMLYAKRGLAAIALITLDLDFGPKPRKPDSGQANN